MSLHLLRSFLSPNRRDHPAGHSSPAGRPNPEEDRPSPEEGSHSRQPAGSHSRQPAGMSERWKSLMQTGEAKSIRTSIQSRLLQRHGEDNLTIENIPAAEIKTRTALRLHGSYGYMSICLKTKDIKGIINNQAIIQKACRPCEGFPDVFSP